jgi:hypothetical protein
MNGVRDSTSIASAGELPSFRLRITGGVVSVSRRGVSARRSTSSVWCSAMVMSSMIGPPAGAVH